MNITYNIEVCFLTNLDNNVVFQVFREDDPHTNSIMQYEIVNHLKLMAHVLLWVLAKQSKKGQNKMDKLRKPT